jgi:hypothetical protein
MTCIASRGGALCIIPVQSQHRGRLFLPFADNDPKTAEILSKVILLPKTTRLRIQLSWSSYDRRRLALRTAYPFSSVTLREPAFTYDPG